MMRRPAITLGQVFALTLLGLVILLGLLFYLLLDGSRSSILKASEKLRLEVGQRVRTKVVNFRDQAEGVVDSVEQQFTHGLVRVDDRDGLESALYAQVLNHPDIGDVSFTHADEIGRDATALKFAPTNRWEISVYRDDAGNIIKRRIIQPPGNPVGDPTTRLTFVSLTMPVNLGQSIWSDLHYSELSGAQVEVSVQKAILDGPKFLGVMRVGLLTSQLNRLVRRDTQASEDAVETGGQSMLAAHTCFLCDPQGRLITPVGQQEQLQVSGDDLRIATANLPPEVDRALQLDALRSIDDRPTGAVYEAGGKRFLATFLPLPRTQGWVLGVIGSEQLYLGDLIAARNRLLLFAAIVMAVILLGGIVTVRAVRHGLTRVLRAAAGMPRFDFTPTPGQTAFVDIQRVLDSLEQAKTAIRAMGKYVPLDLVRDLYEMNREPQLGGELRDMSVLFTDIKDFTTFAERLSPDRLAVALGRYLEVMTDAIHRHGGTIDKYIGDSVMAIWNAPRPTDNHPAKACAAALACTRAARELFASDAWAGLPPLVTRCGLNRDVVMVGHFGAPDRMSYTVMGDGVNLASRLEGLNKQYGTMVIVSQTVRDAVGDAFQFRLLDRVAVVGKMQPVEIYELLGERSEGNLRTAAIEAYETALRTHWRREFVAAIEILQNPDDAPSQKLLARCRMLIDDPPAENWDGVFVAMMK
jgi:adenylate cyclase